MTDLLKSHAEKKAEEAAQLDAFSGVQLKHIRKNIAELMQLIGRGGFFGSYTKHDINHVDRMLEIVDWLIPSKTAEKFSPADWLMLVLSIYLHDLGLLVTEQEFRNRDRTLFDDFKNRRLLSPDNDGKDYEGKLQTLDEDARERFLYEEFVRAHHAERIRRWIDRPSSQELGDATAVAQEICKLLEPLSGSFKSDLGLICESHHYDSLEDTSKFSISKPYGNSKEECVNLQYIAIILRSVDLLQITKDRTPSIQFRVLNPSDPTSQQEWAKHLAVHAVRPQSGRNRDGHVDHDAAQHVIEVHARFENEVGFFGLTHYLTYAEDQLRLSHKWAEESVRKHGSLYEFPWDSIDQSTIDTEGFLREQFTFEVDQQRILTLLTGHTLYNDSNVVVRELTQNAIDAVRLQFIDEADNAVERGRVDIQWDSRRRTLTVQDNGTGMTQEIVERNFLKVGSSRYQEPSFREHFPTFSPISRFGIGVLTAFMVADSVEVVTVHPDEPQARQISLRTVHGKYLIRLLDKETSEEVKEIGAHGTRISITVRASSTVGDILQLTSRWFTIPGCGIRVTIDDSVPQLVGAKNVHEALRSSLNKYMGTTDLEDHNIEIRTGQRNGLELAYAVRWLPYFRQWELLRHSTNRQQIDLERAPSIGICIEGVQVVFGSPGFSDFNGVWAIANATGLQAPRTNVARSALEITDEFERLIHDIYSIYLEHVSSELDKMTERGFSSSKALQECTYLRSPFEFHPLVSPRQFKTELREHRTAIVEVSGDRHPISTSRLRDYPILISIEDDLLRDAEALLRQVPRANSLEKLAEVLPDLAESLPDGPLLVNLPSSGYESELFYEEWQVSRIEGDQSRPRLTLHWTNRESDSFWQVPSLEDRATWAALQSTVRRLDNAFEYQHYNRRTARLLFATDSVSATGLDDYDIAVSQGGMYFLPGRSWVNLFQQLDAEMAKAGHPHPSGATLGAFLISVVLRMGANEYGTVLSNGASTDWQDLLSVFKDRYNGPLDDITRQFGIDSQRTLSLLRAVSMIPFDIGDWRREG